MLGERIHLLVVVDAAHDTSPALLRVWGRDRLGPFKAPDVVHLVPEIPLGSTGKADRRAAKEWATSAPTG